MRGGGCGGWGSGGVAAGGDDGGGGVGAGGEGGWGGGGEREGEDLGGGARGIGCTGGGGDGFTVPGEGGAGGRSGGAGGGWPPGGESRISFRAVCVGRERVLPSDSLTQLVRAARVASYHLGGWGCCGWVPQLSGGGSCFTWPITSAPVGSRCRSSAVMPSGRTGAAHCAGKWAAGPRPSSRVLRPWPSRHTPPGAPRTCAMALIAPDPPRARPRG